MSALLLDAQSPGAPAHPLQLALLCLPMPSGHVAPALPQWGLAAQPSVWLATSFLVALGCQRVAQAQPGKPLAAQLLHVA